MSYAVKASIGQRVCTTTIQIKDLTIYADEPLEKGGQNMGPGPKDLLLASLGSCTCITVRMYADRKQLTIDGIDVELSLTEEDVDGKHFTTITRQITIHGILTDEQRDRLLHVANACPVHKILTGTIDIKTALQ